MKISLLAVLISVLGCGASAPTRAALHADLPTLRSEIAQAQRAGELDEQSVRTLAEAVAERELRAATGAMAVQRIREFRSCLRPLEETFLDISEGQTLAAAAATHALLSAELLDGSALLAQHATSEEPTWRAVAARAAVGPHESGVRRQFYRDGDLRVRRAALHAALAEPDPGDFSDLAEAARVDPDPLVRSQAVRALGALGGRRAARTLRDLWARAELPTRQGIASAWGRDASFIAGGEEQLLWVLETQTDLPTVVAAQILAQKSSRHRAQATAVLERLITDGSPDERRLAIQLAPIESATEAVIADLIKQDSPEDESLQVMSAARLMRSLAHQKRASKTLENLLSSKSESIRRQARAALIAVRSPVVTQSLRGVIAQGTERARGQAAIGLFVLGHPSEAATALGDERGRVRAQVACAILAQR